MNSVHVAAGKPYDVLIERGLIARSGETLKAALGNRTCAAAILTDDTVDALYGETVEASLARSGFRVCRFAIPHGETHKNIATWAQMLDFLAAGHITRTDAVVALGGGVVGDMAGFAAASYLRGVGFMQIPTTLLAMVDSSVGGKTGVNLSAGKNQVGAFYQPVAVLCDPDTLQTLPPDTLADGVAESIKYGVLGDAALFELLCGAKWQGEMERVIATCVAAKAKLVAEDERDTGSRQLLNLGHTLGHGIEKCSHFSISHGHAVAVGMVYAARLAQRLGLCGADGRERIEEALKANNLPVSAPYDAEALCSAALSDKKRAGGQIVFVLPHAIGACELHRMDVADLPRLVRLAVEE